MAEVPIIAKTCPACDRERTPSAAECPFCGVVYERYRPRLPAEALTPIESPASKTVRLSLAQRERFLDCAAQALEAGLSVQQFVSGPALVAFPAGLRAALHSALEADKTFARALADAQVIDGAAAALLVAGETQGKLPAALRTLARRYRAARETRRRTLLALAYPTFLFVAASLVLPLPTLVTRGVGAYTSAAIPPVALVTALYVAVLVVLPRLPATTLRSLKAVLVRVPILSTLARYRATATFAETLGAGIAAGLPIRLGVQLSADATDHPRIAPHKGRILTDLDRGARLAEALEGLGFFAPEDLALVHHGEQVGKLDEVLPRMAEDHERRARTLTITLVVVAGLVVSAAVVLLLAISIIDGFSSYMQTLEKSVDGLFLDL